METTEAPTPGRLAIFLIQFDSLSVDEAVGLVSVGDQPVRTGGFQLCQGAACFALPDAEWDGIVRICAGQDDGICDLAAEGSWEGFDRRSGEMALFASDAFDDPDSIMAYVEWGEAGHRHSSVAIEAGIWWEGAFVPVPEEHNQLFWSCCRPDEIANPPVLADWRTGSEGG